MRNAGNQPKTEPVNPLPPPAQVGGNSLERLLSFCDGHFSRLTDETCNQLIEKVRTRMIERRGQK